MFKWFYNLSKRSKVKKCPFCGNYPIYDERTKLVHCDTLDCAIYLWFIYLDEWNKRK